MCKDKGLINEIIGPTLVDCKDPVIHNIPFPNWRIFALEKPEAVNRLLYVGRDLAILDTVKFFVDSDVKGDSRQARIVRDGDAHALGKAYLNSRQGDRVAVADGGQGREENCRQLHPENTVCFIS